jgi:hypothetical protein
MWILHALLCAFANRVRGGLYGDQIREVAPFWATTPARITLSFTLFIPALLIHGPTLYLLTALGGWVGLMPRWSPWQDMLSKGRDTCYLTARGLLTTLIPGLILWNPLLAVSGAGMGLMYLLASVITYKHVESNGYVWTTSDYGEVLYGAWLGATIWLSIV